MRAVTATVRSWIQHTGSRAAVSGDMSRSSRRAGKQGLGTLAVACPCVICSFTIIVLVLCFCACPLLQYRLRGQVGYDYFAFLYFVAAFLVFGVVVECLLVAWRKGCLACCCCSRRDVDDLTTSSDNQPAFSKATFVDGYVSLADDPGLKSQLCSVHARPRGPPPAYDFRPVEKNYAAPPSLEHPRDFPAKDDADVKLKSGHHVAITMQ